MTKNSNGADSVTMEEALEITQAGKPVGLLSKLAKPQNMLAPSSENLTRVSTNKPKKDVYFRVHADYFQDLISIVDKDGMEATTYVIVGDVLEQAMTEEAITSMLQNRRYYLYVTQVGSYGLWGVTYPMDEGQDINSWTESALTVIHRAQSEWLRHYAKRGDGGYRIILASKDLGEPKWPKESWEEIVELAFKGNIIDDINHPIFEKLRGNLI
jgi:hypothetical protein